MKPHEEFLGNNFAAVTARSCGYDAFDPHSFMERISFGRLSFYIKGANVAHHGFRADQPGERNSVVEHVRCDHSHDHPGCNSGVSIAAIYSHGHFTWGCTGVIVV